MSSLPRKRQATAAVRAQPKGVWQIDVREGFLLFYASTSATAPCERPIKAPTTRAGIAWVKQRFARFGAAQTIPSNDDNIAPDGALLLLVPDRADRGTYPLAFWSHWTMEWKEAIITVLKGANGPVHYTGIAEMIPKQNLRSPDELGATPAATVNATIGDAQQLSLQQVSLPIVITGLDPVICTSTVPREITGSSPVMTRRDAPTRLVYCWAPP